MLQGRLHHCSRAFADGADVRQTLSSIIIGTFGCTDAVTGGSPPAFLSLEVGAHRIHSQADKARSCVEHNINPNYNKGWMGDGNHIQIRVDDSSICTGFRTGSRRDRLNRPDIPESTLACRLGVTHVRCMSFGAGGQKHSRSTARLGKGELQDFSMSLGLVPAGKLR